MDMPTPIDPALATHSALKARADLAAQNATAAGKDSTDAQIEKVAQDFEAIFLNIMLKEMRKTVGKGGLLGNDGATKMFQEMMDSALAESMAKSKMFGLGNIVAKQMKKQRRET